MTCTRGVVVPVAGAIETLEELRRRDIATALVSNCTEEVALVWEESPFAGLLDVAVFSATAGCMKPDPRIYELALEGLGVRAADALFVGDGANDELAGVERTGMTPVLVQPDGADPPWGDGLERWPGLRDRLCEPGPVLRRHINVYVDRERGGLETALHPSSRVDVVTAISGG